MKNDFDSLYEYIFSLDNVSWVVTYMFIEFKCINVLMDGVQSVLAIFIQVQIPCYIVELVIFYISSLAILMEFKPL
jgi:hypothetical protein